MGVFSDLIIAPADAAGEILASLNPTDDWDGFSFKGLDNVKFATLLSLLSSGSPSADFEKWLDAISQTSEDENGVWVFAFADGAVEALATITSMDVGAFEELAKRLGATEEFEGWEPDDVNDLLGSVGELAERALLEQQAMFLWVCL